MTNPVHLEFKDIEEDIKKREYDKGLEHLKKMPRIVDRAGKSKYHFLYARCLYGLKKYSETILFLAGIRDNSFKILRLRGNAYQQAGRYQAALDVYEKISNKKDIAQNLTKCYVKMGLHQKALQIIEALQITEEKQNHRTRFKSQVILASCKARTGNFSEAEDIYKSFYRWHISLFVIKTYISSCIENKEYQKAIDLAKQYLLLTNEEFGFFPIQLKLSQCYESMGEYQEAIQCYQYALDKKEFDRARLGIARCLFKLKEYTKAIENFKKIEDYEDYQDEYCLYAQCYQAGGDPYNALAIYKKIRHKTSAILLAMGDCYIAVAEHEKAISVYKQVPAFPPNKQAIMGMVECQIALEKYGQAKQIIQRYPHWQEEEDLVSLHKEIHDQQKLFGGTSMTKPHQPKDIGESLPRPAALLLDDQKGLDELYYPLEKSQHGQNGLNKLQTLLEAPKLNVEHGFSKDVQKFFQELRQTGNDSFFAQPLFTAIYKYPKEGRWDAMKLDELHVTLNREWQMKRNRF